MSSIALWSCPVTGVSAHWEKQGPCTVFVPTRVDSNGVVDGVTTTHISQGAAVKAAKRKARALIKETQS